MRRERFQHAPVERALEPALDVRIVDPYTNLQRDAAVRQVDHHRRRRLVAAQHFRLLPGHLAQNPERGLDVAVV